MRTVRVAKLWELADEDAGWGTRPSLLRAAIAGAVVVALYLLIVPQSARLVLELRSNAGADGEIFWDDGEGIHPGHSTGFVIQPDNRWHRYEIDGGGGPWHRVRIDPGTAAGQVELRRVEVQAGRRRKTLEKKQLVAALGFRNQVDLVGGDHGAPLRFRVQRGDPYFEIALPRKAGQLYLWENAARRLLAGLAAFSVWLLLEGIVHELRRRRWARWVALLLMFVLLFLRWGTKGSAFASSASDYGVHIAVVDWVNHRLQWPPPYAGIIGAHAVAAFLRSLGLTIPKAMLVASDIGALLILGSLARVVWPMGVLPRVSALYATLSYSIPLFSVTVRDGYFGPTLAMGLNALGIAALLLSPEKPTTRRLLFAATCFLAGTLCYPDGFLWCMSLWLAVSRPSMARPLWLLIALLVSAVSWRMVSTLVKLFHVSGGGTFEWNEVILTVSAMGWLLLFSPQKSLAARRTQILFFCWASFVALLLTLSHQVTGNHLSYYARKSLYSSLILVPLVAAMLATRKGLGIIALGATAFIASGFSVTLREPIGVAYERFVRPRSHFDGADEACIRRTLAIARKRACKRLLILPGSKNGGVDGWGERIVRTTAFNVYTGEFAIDIGFKALQGGPLDNGFYLAQLIRDAPKRALVETSLDSRDEVDCLGLGAELVTSEKREKGCLVIVTPNEVLEQADSEGFRGSQDGADCSRVHGWVFAPGFPGRRLTVELLADKEVIATSVADAERGDLVAANIDDGRHAFDIALPPSVKDGESHRLTVRVAGTDFVLPGPSEVVCGMRQPKATIEVPKPKVGDRRKKQKRPDP